MDTLALLCTLHADGPASLQLLRAAELYSIDDVLGCSVETTADVLGLSMAQARRFHREARMLAMRMDTEGLDREEQMYPGTMGVEATAMQTAPEMAATTQPMSTTPPPVDAPPAQDRAEEMRKKPNLSAILAPVLKQWEHEDAKTSEVEPEQPPAPSQPAAEVTPCETYVLDGVDDQLREALRAAGYATLTALAEVEPLELSRATGRTYSEACRVRFLAQRAIEGGATEVADTPMTEAHSAFEVSDPTEMEMPGYEVPQEPPTADSDTQAEAERVLAELVGNTDPVTECFSPAPPERELPQDLPKESCAEEEGPGGPFA